MPYSLPGRVPKKLPGTYGLDPKTFIKELNAIGVTVTWQKGMQCPCDTQTTLPGNSGSIIDMTSEPDRGCAACGGDRVAYYDSQSIKAMVTSAEMDPQLFLPYGDAIKGMVHISMFPEHQPGDLDRFTVEDHARRFSETRIRKATVESLRYPIASVTVTHGDADPTDETTTVVKTTNVLAAGTNGEIVMDGGSPKSYAEDTDFEVSGGDIDWSIGDTGGTAPAVGQRYAVDYVCRPVYVTHDLIHTGRWAPYKFKSPTPVMTAYPHFLFARLETMGGSA